MKVKITYLDKILTLTDEKNNNEASDNSLRVIHIGETALQKELESTIKIFLDEKVKENIYLVFESNTLLLSFLMIFSSDYFKVQRAAGGLIFHPEKGYLFIFKNNRWDLPKGKIDKGENAEQAAIRECMEETGISGLSISKNLGLTFHIFNQYRKFILKITQWYLMNTDDKKNLIPQTEEGIEKVEWVLPKQIKEKVMENTYLSIKDVLNNAAVIQKK